MSHPETQTQNENISVSVTQQPGLKVKLEITVSPKATSAAYTKAIKTINKEISLPGFRKGKAPESLVLQHYGKHIQKEWQSTLIETGFKEALTLIEARPLRNDGVKCTAVREISKEKGSQFTIEFEASPIVPSIDLSEISLDPVEREEISDDDVDHSIENLRLYHAQWTAVADRPVQEGDYVDLDIEKLDEPVATLCKDTRFVVDGTMPHWMKKLILGLHLNESTEGMSEKEIETATHFQPTRCKVTVKTILHAALPEVDDAFAQKMGVPTVAELETKVIENLNHRVDEEVREKMHHQIDQHLLERYHFDLPASLIQADKEKRIAERVEWMKKQHLPPETITQQLQELERVLPEEIERTYRLLFLIFKFAREHDIVISQEEIMDELSRQLMQNENPPLLKGLTEPDEIRSKISHHLLLRKSRNYIAEYLTNLSH